MKKVFLSFIFIGLIASLYFNQKLYFEQQLLKQTLSEQGKQLHTISDELKHERNLHQAAVKNQQEVISQIKQSLSNQKLSLDAAEDRMRKIKNIGSTAADLNSLIENVRAQKDTLHELERQLAVYRNNENKVSTTGKQIISQDKWKQQQDIESISSQIKLKTENIHQLNEQLSLLKKQKYDMTAKSQIPSVEKQLIDEKATLQQLKEQKQQYTKQWNAEQGISKIKVQTEQNNIKANEAEIKVQIQSQKESIQRAERILSDAKSGQSKQKNTLSLLVKDYQEQKLKFEEIQNQLSIEEKKLEGLK